MNGYLQCLIDQYRKKFDTAKTPVEKSIYSGMFNDLLNLGRYVEYTENKTSPQEENSPKKHMVAEFIGTMPELMEYLKNLASREGQ